MPKRPGGNHHSCSAKKFHKLSSQNARDSLEDLVRRRVLVQRTRLSRVQQRLKTGNDSQELDFHLDGCRSYEESVLAGDEMATEHRLRHLRNVHRILLSKEQGQTDTAESSGSFTVDQLEKGVSIRPDLVLSLLDQGEAGEAEVVLDDLGVTASNIAAGTPWWEHNPRHRTPLAFSRALVDFVAWRDESKGEESGDGGDDDEEAAPSLVPAGDKEAAKDDEEEEEEEEPSEPELAASRSLDSALQANPYVGVFLANLAVFVREIDPAVAAEASAVALKGGDLSKPPKGRKKGEARDKKKKKGASSSADDDEEEPTEGTAVASGPFEGSVEEALSYAASAAGCWMDFIGQGVEDWVAERLSMLEEGGSDSEEGGSGGGGGGDGGSGSGGVVWPPRRCSHPEGLKLQALFVRAVDLAEAEAEEAGTTGGEGEGASEEEEGDGEEEE